MMSCMQKITFLLVLYDFISCAVGDHLINSFSGFVGHGNYTYYKLMQRGYIRLILDTLDGDADLYISSRTSNPTFADYDMQSVTCGEDIVDIPPDVHRPITIGVYGYTANKRTKYILHVITISDYDHGYPEDAMAYEFVSESPTKAAHNSNKQSFGSAMKDEEESIIWTILVSVLKLLLDILM